MVADMIDMPKVARWAIDLSNIYSHSGHEAGAAHYLYDEYRKLGLQCKLQPVTKTRANAIARLQGTGGGYELMLVGHLDRHELPRLGRSLYSGEKLLLESENLPSARVVDDKQLYGHRIVDTNAALAGYLGAVDAILRSGKDLRGSIVIAGIVGAQATATWTNGDPITPGEELGAGARYMLSNGLTADMCVVAEPTSQAILSGHLGRLRVKVNLADNLTISNVRTVLSSFEDWIKSHEGTPHAKDGSCHAYLAGIHGLPHGGFSIYFEVRIAPGHHPLDTIGQIRTVAEQVQAKHGMRSIVVEPILVEPGTRIDVNAPILHALQRAHEHVTRSPAKIVEIGLGGDAVRLNAAGIPTVVYGPGKLPYDSHGFTNLKGDDWDYQSVEELHNVAQVYATLAVDICSRSRFAPK